MTDIWSVVEDYLAAERLELDDLEMSGRGRNRVLRIIVDGDDVNLDRLAELSRGISRLLDDEPSLQESYQLEVTSPGLERKLTRPSHFTKSIGREVAVKAAGAERNEAHRGTITTADETGFTLDSDNGPITISYEDIISAKTVFRWEKAPKPGH